MRWMRSDPRLSVKLADAGLGDSFLSAFLLAVTLGASSWIVDIALFHSVFFCSRAGEMAVFALQIDLAMLPLAALLSPLLLRRFRRMCAAGWAGFLPWLAHCVLYFTLWATLVNLFLMREDLTLVLSAHSFLRGLLYFFASQLLASLHYGVAYGLPLSVIFFTFLSRENPEMLAREGGRPMKSSLLIGGMLVILFLWQRHGWPTVMAPRDTLLGISWGML